MILYHGTSKYCAGQIRKNGFDFSCGLKKKQSGSYGQTVSFTDSLDLAKQFGGGVIKVELAEDIKLYEMSTKEEESYRDKQKEKTKAGERIRKDYDGIKFENTKYFEKEGTEYQIFNLEKITVSS